VHDMYYYLHFNDTTNITIRNNHVYDTYEPVQSDYNANTIVDRNLLHHAINPGIALASCCYAIYLSGQNMLITNNVIYAQDSYCIHIKASPTTGSHTSAVAGATGVIANNTCAYTSRTGGLVAFSNGATLAQMTPLRIQNNIFFQLRTAGGSNSLAAIRFLDLGAISGRVVSRNVIFSANDPTGASAILCTSSGLGQTNNEAWCNSNGWMDTSGGNSKTVNPMLVNAPLTLPASPDFHLTTGSIAKDFGANLTSFGVTTDYEGAARPSGSAFDAGAYEFGTDTTPPAAPTGLTVQ
jgi:hypothetical protein